MIVYDDCFVVWYVIEIVDGVERCGFVDGCVLMFFFGMYVD